MNGVYGALPRFACGHYSALVQRRGTVSSAFYFKDDLLWAFALAALVRAHLSLGRRETISTTVCSARATSSSLSGSSSSTQPVSSSSIAP